MNKEALENRDRRIKGLAREAGQDAAWKKNMVEVLAELNNEHFALMMAHTRMQKELQELKRETV
jgi:energy-coupling factor transporter ATP-binding protein EcfA2